MPERPPKASQEAADLRFHLLRRSYGIRTPGRRAKL
jgi:hypothetical protein